jgi:Ca-activated chloride channel homolog
MKRITFPTALAALAIVLLAAFALADALAPKATLSVTVTDDISGNPLKGVNIYIKETKQHTLTNTSGIATVKIDAGETGSRNVTVIANHPNYTKKTQQATITANQTTNVTFQLTAGIDKERDEYSDVAAQPEEKSKLLSRQGYGGAMKGMPSTLANGFISTGDQSALYLSYDELDQEAYSKINENEFRSVKENPLSTFSIDVDNASYSNVRRFINQGSVPPKDAVRVEEMINYFTYDYPQPKDEHPFAIVTELADCPWQKEHKLIHVGIKGKEIEKDNLPPSNIVFLLDVSGSMQGPNRLGLVKKSFRLLVDQMRKEDKVAIVVYAGAAGVVLPSTSGDDKETILAAIEKLEAGGSTAGGEGIKLAYKIARDNMMRNGNNRVILATDGDFNVGVTSDGELVRIIEAERESGVFLTVLGYGMGNYKDSKMEQLADKGNGNYAYIDNILEAEKQLVKQMGGTLHTIAKDVKIQIEFNPAFVKGYRLIGYENRVLAKEDFNNDKKDAGELGAGHTVTALYEVIPAGVSNAHLDSVDGLKYQTTAITNAAGTSDELMTVKFRYKQPKDTVSKLITMPVRNSDAKSFASASENLRFASSVIEFGMMLTGSKFKGTTNTKDILAMARNAKGRDDEGYRAEFIKLIEMFELMDKAER